MNRSAASLMLFLLLVSIPSAAIGASRPTIGASSDPGTLGHFAVGIGDYDLGTTRPIEPTDPTEIFPYLDADRDQEWALHLRGEAYYPLQAHGKRPIVVFVHGNHVAVVDSFRGYADSGRLLASHGFTVLSVDANEVNGQIHAAQYIPDHELRAAIVLGTLDHLRDRAPDARLPAGFPSALDFDNVGLVGHSRGGTGIQIATNQNAERVEPFGIRALLGLAPDGGHRPVGDVVYATIAGTCDGDTGMGGAINIFDGARSEQREFAPSARHLLIAMGANHNFYNSYWTEDDWDVLDNALLGPTPGAEPETVNDPACGPIDAPDDSVHRMSPDDQRRHLAAYASAFFQTYLGGENEYLAWLTGLVEPPASACPAQLPCAGFLHMTYQPAADRRTLIEDAADVNPGLINDLGGAVRFEGFSKNASCEAPPRTCLMWWEEDKSSTGVAASSSASVIATLNLIWNQPAVMRLEIPSARADQASGRSVLLRAGVNPAGPLQSQDFRVVLIDALGRSASVNASDHTAGLYYPPGRASQTVVLHGINVPLDAFTGIDLSNLAAIELAFDRTPEGDIQIADVWFAQ